MQVRTYELNATVVSRSDLHINETKNTPEIIFKALSNEWFITGKSYPGEAEEVYMPLKLWIDHIHRHRDQKMCTAFQI